MKAVITGANGHIGSRIVRTLLDGGHDVRAMVRKSSDLRGLEVLRDQVDLVVADVLDASSLRPVMEGRTHLFHAATLFSHDVDRSPEITRTALEGTENIVRAAARCGSIERIIHTSSCAVVGNTQSADATRNESDSLEDDDEVYRRAKTESELLAFRLAREVGIDLVAVNPAVVLGPGDYRPTPSSGIVVRFLERGSPIYWTGGRSHVDVDDVARGHVLAAERGRAGERYILAGENVTIAQSCRWMAEMSGMAAPRIRVGRLPMWCVGAAFELLGALTRKRPVVTRQQATSALGRFMYYDSSKAARELGYTHRPAREVFERAMAWFLCADVVDPAIRERAHAHFVASVGRSPQDVLGSDAP